MKNYFLGLDIGGTKCAVLLAKVDRGIQIIDKLRFLTQTEQGFCQTFEKLCEELEKIVLLNGLSFSMVEALGVSCGGPLDSEKGVILCPPNLPGWVNIPLKEMLEQRFDLPVYIQNDANACALVEWKLGAGRGCDDMIFLTMGTGMGGGIIAKGQLLCGCSDMCGEVGHLRLSENGPIGFGKAGSFEGYCSGGGIQRQAVEFTRELLAQGEQPAWVRDGLGESQVDAKIMAEYARRNDAHATTFFHRVGAMLGKGLALLVDTLNPERIVIGSVFVRCEELLRPAMEEALRKEAIAYSMEKLSVLPAATDEQLGDLASVMVALYALGIDVLAEANEQNERVLAHYKRLFERYPVLRVCEEQVMRAYLCLRDCYIRQGKVLLMGNGGSCADSQHIEGELMKGFYLKRPLTDERKVSIRRYTESILPGVAEILQQGLPAITLMNHAPLSTAVANDQAPVLVAAQQIVSYGKTGDVFLGISTSGNAQNVRLAAATAKALGLRTIGLTGQTGGKLREVCDIIITVPATVTADVQELHLPVYHTLCAMLEAKFFTC